MFGSTRAGALWRLAGLVVAAPLGLAAQAAAGRALPPGVIRVQRAEIMDRAGFEKPLVAATILIPVGWKAEGGVEWNPTDPCGQGHRVNWRARSPDGLGAIQILPEEKWSHASFPVPDNPCLQSPVSDSRAYLQWYVQRQRPGARILDFRARPDLVQRYQSLNSTTPMSGASMRSWVEAGEVLVGYQVNGKPVREAISVVTFFIHTRMAGLGAGQEMETLQGSTFPGFAMRAPEGQLDFSTVEAIRKSAQPGPEWSARMARAAQERGRIQMEANRQMAETNRRAAAERSAIIAQTSREINDIQMGTWSQRNESMDRTQRETIEGIRGVETYSDPHHGGTVQLSNDFQHAWQLRDGSYLLSNDVNFDPARVGLEGQRLKRAP